MNFMLNKQETKDNKIMHDIHMHINICIYIYAYTYTCACVCAYTEAVVWRCSVKKVFLEISQNSK